MQYVKKPITIDAMEYTGSFDEVRSFGGDIVRYGIEGPTINTPNGILKINMGDFVIKGIGGEIYPCPANTFRECYEKVE